MSKRKLTSVLYVAIFGLALVISSFYFQKNNHKQYFVLNDPLAEYSIQEFGPHYGVRFRKTGKEEMMILVGSSPVSLEPYLGKRVKIQGEFRNRFGNILCRPGYEDQCEKIKAFIIDITSITLIK
jgi:hypothetical protein